MTAFPPEIQQIVSDTRARYEGLARELELLRREREDLSADRPAAAVVLDTIRAVLNAAAADPTERRAEIHARMIQVEAELQEIMQTAAASGIRLG